MIMRYKTIIWIAAAVMGVSLSSCSSDEETIPSKVKATTAGTFTDERDGTVYNWVRYGNLDWMAQNFAYTDGGSDVTVYLDYDEHEDNPNSLRNVPKYGRLYSYGAAKRLCPEGWRLPTDAEWQSLEQQLGMSASDAAKREWRGNIMHSMVSFFEDPCDLNLLLGGYYTTHTIMATSGWRASGSGISREVTSIRLVNPAFRSSALASMRPETRVTGMPPAWRRTPIGTLP